MHLLRCGRGSGLFMLIRCSDNLKTQDQYDYYFTLNLYQACSGIMITARNEKHACTEFK